MKGFGWCSVLKSIWNVSSLGHIVFHHFYEFPSSNRLKIFEKEWLIKKLCTVWLVLPNYFSEKYKKLSKITIQSSPKVHST